MRRRLLAAAIVGCALSGVTRADAPNGSFAIDFGLGNAVFGGAPLALEDCTDTRCLTIQAAVGPSGRLSGEVGLSGSVVANGVTGIVETHGAVRGRARGRDGHAKLELSSRLRGFVTSPYVAIPLAGRLVSEARPDGVAGTVTGSIAIVLCGNGCSSDRTGTFTESLGSEDGGGWHLALELATDARGRVTGGAVANFDDGSDPIEFAASGRYDPGRDTSRVRLSSVAPGPGARVSLRNLWTDGDSLLRFDLRYRVRGQSGGLVAFFP